MGVLHLGSAQLLESGKMKIADHHPTTTLWTELQQLKHPKGSVAAVRTPFVFSLFSDTVRDAVQTRQHSHFED